MKPAHLISFPLTVKPNARLRLNQRAITGKTGRVLVCAVCLAATPYFVPGLERFRTAARSSLTGLLNIRGGVTTTGEAEAPNAEAIEPARSQESSQIHTASGYAQAIPGEIEDPSG